MKNLIFLIGLTFLYSCGKEAKVTVTEVGPRISEGYYAINNPDQYNLPLVAVKSVKGNMESYGLLKFQCGEKTFQSYEYAGITFSDRPASIAGRNENHRDCDIETKITAESDTSIKVTVILNDKEIDSYSLNKVTKEEFVNELKFFAEGEKGLDLEEEICRKSLDSACDILN